jgi:hypothetical protein
MASRRSAGFRVLLGIFALGALAATGSCASGGGGSQDPRPAGGGGRGALEGPPPEGIAPIVDSIPDLFGIPLDTTIRAERFDQGRMWTFEHLPVEYFSETYGFAPDSAWLRHVRLATLRIPGCSASFVSPAGLVLTNHHCAREAVAKVTREGENLVRDGFFARTPEEERPVEDFHADQLLAIHDVSDEVDRRLALAPASLREQRREEIQQEIGERVSAEYGGESAGINVEMVALYAGARTSAYVYRRYPNVKLVMAPELRVGFFGGDPDNFTYPRFNLDFAFLRVYDSQGNPLRSDPFFRWSTTGSRDGDPVFVVGNPGTTSRHETVAQLMFRRDVSDKAIFDFVQRRARIFEAFARANPALVEPYELENTIFDLQNSAKAYEGQIAGLRDPVILARLRDREESFRSAIDSDSLLEARYGGVLGLMAQLQQRRRQSVAGYTFLALGSAAYESPTLYRALLAFQYAEALRRAQPITVRNELRDQILAVPSKPAELDEELIQDRLQAIVDAYGTGSELALRLLDGRSAEGAAAYLRSSSVFADSARAAGAIASGNLPMDDPALRVVQAYMPALGRFEQTRAALDRQEIQLAEQIGRARFAVHGTTVPPDATFSLRLADGVVSGYRAGGSAVPAYTTLSGIFERNEANRARFTPPESSPWHLPARWLSPPPELDRSTPLNFVSTADIAGGSSGSPVVGRNLEIVGVAFDGNLESLPGAYLYRPDVQRAVSVDVRGILHSLDVLYDMDRLVSELTTGQTLPVAGVGGTPR